MTLLSEFRKQFNLNEWLDAMKQGIKELFNQWSISEWAKAFFAYMPTATGVKPKGGAKLMYQGGTSDEIFTTLNKLKHDRN